MDLGGGTSTEDRFTLLYLFLAGFPGLPWETIQASGPTTGKGTLWLARAGISRPVNHLVQALAWVALGVRVVAVHRGGPWSCPSIDNSTNRNQPTPYDRHRPNRYPSRLRPPERLNSIGRHHPLYGATRVRRATTVDATTPDSRYFQIEVLSYFWLAS